jgi:predicted transcriptional regulator
MIDFRRWSRAPRFGELEIAVMECLWERGALSVREVQESIATRGLALSTVQSTLERLTRKRMLKRIKQSRAFVYEATVDRTELIGRLLRDLSAEFATGRFEPLFSGFLTLVDELEPASAEAALETLRRRIEKQ